MTRSLPDSWLELLMKTRNFVALSPRLEGELQSYATVAKG